MISGEDCCKKKSQKRLQLVFRATYFVISLSKKVACKGTLVLHLILLCTQSYVAIEIHASNAHNFDDEPFLNVDKDELADMVKDRKFDNLSKYGGTKKLAATLETDENKGISSGVGGIKKRVEEFASDTYKKAPVRSFLSFLTEAFKDSTIILLLLFATLYLGFGIKQPGPKEGWYDGGSIIVSVVLVLAVSATSNFKQSRQFLQLSSESSNIEVKVVRDRRRQSVSIIDAVVGDIVCLKTGGHIPVHGLFLDGRSMKVDESSMTGESDQVEINETGNPFLLSGTKVMDGYGRMLVTSVGMKTTWVR